MLLRTVFYSLCHLWRPPSSIRSSIPVCFPGLVFHQLSQIELKYFSFISLRPKHSPLHWLTNTVIEVHCTYTVGTQGLSDVGELCCCAFFNYCATRVHKSQIDPVVYTPQDTRWLILVPLSLIRDRLSCIYLTSTKETRRSWIIVGSEQRWVMFVHQHAKEACCFYRI